MTREEAQTLIRKSGSMRAAARAAGMHRDTLARIASGQDFDLKPGRITTGLMTVKPRSVAEFRNLYDLNVIVPKKVELGLKQLGAGWLYEAEFAKLCGLSLKDLGMFRDNYIEHVVVVRDSRRVWAGKTSTAQKLRGAL